MTSEPKTPRGKGLATALVAALSYAPLTAWTFRYALPAGESGVFRETDLPLERGDQLLHGWTLDWVYHRLLQDPLRLFDANVFYPHPQSLAFSDHLFGEAVTFFPIRLLISDPLRLNSLATLSTFVLAGAAVFLLVFSLTRRFAPSWVAGLLYAFNPFRVHNLAQIQLLTDFSIPLCFLFLHRYQRTGRARHLGLLAAAFSWQVLCSAYLGAYLAVPLGVVFLIGLRRGRGRSLVPWAGLALAALIAAVMLAPFLYPYLRLQAVAGLHQHILNSIYFSVGLADLVCWSECAPALGRILVPFTLVLSAAALLPPGRRGGAPKGVYVCVALVGIAMALGPYVRLYSGGGPDSDPEFLFPGPYLLLYKFVPGFDGLRAPVRAVAFYHFGMSILAGFGAARILSVARRLAVWPFVAAGLVGVAIFSIEPSRATFQRLPHFQTPPPVYRWLAEDSERGPVVEIPVRSFDDLAMVYAYHSRIHRRPLVNGYSGVLPYSYQYIQTALRCYPCERALRVLAELEVGTHVVHLELMAPPQRALFQARIDAVPSLNIRRRFKETIVVSFVPGPDLLPRPPDRLASIDRSAWIASSSRGPRGVEAAFDTSRSTYWSTALELSDLDDPWLGTRFLRGVTTWREFMRLARRDEASLTLDLGGVHPARRAAIVFSEEAGRVGRPLPLLEGSEDGIQWKTLASEATVRPSLRAMAEGWVNTRFEYDWSPAPVRYLRFRHPGYWFLYDVAVFE